MSRETVHKSQRLDDSDRAKGDAAMSQGREQVVLKWDGCAGERERERLSAERGHAGKGHVADLHCLLVTQSP